MDEEEDVESPPSLPPKIQIFPSCWGDFDLNLLLQRHNVVDPHSKVLSVHQSLGLHEKDDEETQIYNGQCYIPDYEEEIPSQELRQRYSKALIIKQTLEMKKFNERLPASDVLQRRMKILKVVLQTIFTKYHKSRFMLNKRKKLGNGKARFLESEINNFLEEQRQEDVLYEFGIKTVTIFLFTFMRRSWASSDPSIHSVCSDVLKTCSEMLLTIPKLSLSNETQLPKPAINGLNDYMKFLVEVIETNHDATSCQYAFEILLGISLQRGSVMYLLDWINLCIKTSFSKQQKIMISTDQFTHWMKQLVDSEKVFLLVGHYRLNFCLL